MAGAAFTHTHGLTALLFPAGVRLSTWLGIAAFAGLAIVRRDSRPLIAAAAWFAGFEAVYQLTCLATGHGRPVSNGAIAVVVIVAAAAVTFAARRGINPSPWIMLTVALVWLAWVAIGFPANAATLVGLNSAGEALNEAAKTLWAVAYLVPLLSLGTRKARPTTRAGRAFWIRRGTGGQTQA